MKEAVALLYILAASCVWLIHGATDPGDVSALNIMFTDFESNPTLTKWVQNAGDPCSDLWLGVTCNGTFVTAIQLPNCGLAGKVHGSVLQQFQHVTVIDLSNNNFDSDVPEQFPPNLVNLDLSNNEFTGNFPDQLKNVPSLQSIMLNNNKLDGTLIAQTFTILVNVVTLDLSKNKFSGTIPASVGDTMVSLKFLYLQNNKFTGQLPTSLSNLVALQVFDVSNNELTGYLPPNFNPTTFSYQGNDIEQQAPPPPPYTAPPPPKNSNTPPNSNTPLASTKSSSSSLTGPKVAAIVVVILVALAAAALAVWFFVIRKIPRHGTETLDLEANHNHSGRFCIWCLPLFSTGTDDEKPAKVKAFDPDTTEKGMEEPKIKAQPPIETLSIPPVYKDEDPMTKKTTEKVNMSHIPVTAFKVADLQAATNSFSEKTNFLGEGSLGRVYRADFPDGRVLAVKKLDIKASMVENENDFLSVVEGLAKLQHSNATELVGYCVEHEQRVLVYEYLSRGTLHELLHCSEDDNGLSWNMRVKIALGSARALEYLHEVCSPPVVHRNFKSANILLDDELNPHVSDCGLEALLLSTTERQVSAQRLSTSGYSAPEYSMSGTYTIESDVYSLGVVMLELLTGRKPFDSSRSRSEQSLVRWATPQLHDIDSLAKMVDPALGGLYPTKSLSRLADIVALCVQPEPGFRPPMSEVVQSLVRLMQRATLRNRRTDSNAAASQPDKVQEPNE